MGVKITRQVSVEVDGKTVVFSPDKDRVTESQTIGIICDSPRCAARHENASFITWDHIRAKEDSSTLPDGYEGFHRIYPNPFDDEYIVWVCSRECGKDFYTYSYVKPNTAKKIIAERAEKLVINTAAQEAIDEALAEGYKANAEFDRNNQMVLPFGEPTEFAAQTVEAVEDSTGYPN